MRLTFHGVRGSTPCHGPDVQRHGGNTSCVTLDAAGAPPILFDIGTGARHAAARGPFDGVCLLGHLHWDHVQGLPFFPPLLSPEGRLRVLAPPPGDGRSVSEVIADAIRPPLFPVALADLPGTVEFVDCTDSVVEIGSVTVTIRSVPHVGPTVGFRVAGAAGSVAYVSDHQQPTDRSIPDGVRELCEGVDVLIHDAQYTDDEFAHRSHWGHSTYGYALELARECAVGTLVLFHHDPQRSDDELDVLVDRVRELAGDDGPRIDVAVEGMCMEVAT